MLLNFIFTAFRSLSKNRLFSIINILGLAVSLAVCILITMFINDELSYDKYNDKADRIFRINADIHINGNGIVGNYAPPPLAAAMVKDFPLIEDAVRIRKIDQMLVKKGEDNILETRAVFADASLFNIFTLDMSSGDPATALVEPYSMVISENMAKKYFNTIEAVGKTLVVDNSSTYRITGVIKGMPQQSHFHFDFIKAMSEKKNLSGPGFWLNPHSSTYLLTKPGVNAKQIDQMLAATVTKYIDPQLKHDMQSSSADLAKKGDYFRYYSMPLLKIHLYSNITREFETNSNIQNVYIFIITASLIFLIACINFVNLSTARSAHRSREVGIRKMLGSLRSSLVKYFLVESTLTSVFATVLAVLIVVLIRPYFNQLTGKEFLLADFFTSQIIAIYFFVVPLVGLLAGSYPAFYLSAFKPLKVLTATSTGNIRSGWLRDGLVVVQFSAAIFLIIGTFVIHDQLNYIKNRDLGYKREEVITINNTNSLHTQVRAFANELNKIPGVLGSTVTGALPNRFPDVGGRGYFKDATQKASETFIMGSYDIDADYVPLLKIKMLKGRNFSAALPTDSFKVLINETAANLLGYGDNPIDKPLYISGSNPENPEGGFKVLGVIKDFNAWSLHEKIEPVVFHLGEDNSAVSLRVDMGKLSTLIPSVKKTYRSFNTAAGQPFTYSFMDDDFNNLYQSDTRTAKIYLSLTIFAIFIACLGLYGLIAYSAEKRTKEMGIRKVLGATTTNLLGLLSKDFLKLILISIIISWPLAFWSMQKWLESYAYRTGISWWIFPLAGAASLLIAIFTMMHQVMRTVSANPADTLKTD